MNARAMLEHLFWDKRYPLAGPIVDGREVRPGVPNLGSIAASCSEEHQTLRGIREVALSLFAPSRHFDDRVRGLAAQIQESESLNPLIVVDDGHPDGPYILEGAHRLDALFFLKASSFPALVVLDEAALNVTENVAALHF